MPELTTTDLATLVAAATGAMFSAGGDNDTAEPIIASLRALDLPGAIARATAELVTTGRHGLTDADADAGAVLVPVLTATELAERYGHPSALCAGSGHWWPDDEPVVGARCPWCGTLVRLAPQSDDGRLRARIVSHPAAAHPERCDSVSPPMHPSALPADGPPTGLTKQQWDEWRRARLRCSSVSPPLHVTVTEDTETGERTPTTVHARCDECAGHDGLHRGRPPRAEDEDERATYTWTDHEAAPTTVRASSTVAELENGWTP